jgi:hypothetical protein
MIALCKIDQIEIIVDAAGPPRSQVPPDQSSKISFVPFRLVDVGRQRLPQMNGSHQLTCSKLHRLVLHGKLS